MSARGGLFWGRQGVVLLLTVLRGRLSRRRLMLGLALGGVAMVWLGGFLIETWLEVRPILFLGYWAIVGWIVVVLMVLSLYDMLQVRRSILMREGMDAREGPEDHR
jgi:peptidoglycan/LPS O-acetylase OafA/YrhL